MEDSFHMTNLKQNTCDKCNKSFESILVFSYDEKKYCVTCISELYKEGKIPFAFVETVSRYEVENRIINAKTLTLATLSKKNFLITQSNTQSNGILPPGILEMNIKSSIDSSKVYERLLKEKENNKDTNKQ
jgi:hypothetical protein